MLCGASYNDRATLVISQRAVREGQRAGSLHSFGIEASRCINHGRCGGGAVLCGSGAGADSAALFGAAVKGRCVYNRLLSARVLVDRRLRTNEMAGTSMEGPMN